MGGAAGLKRPELESTLPQSGGLRNGGSPVPRRFYETKDKYEKKK
jgi:hypothetical protein